MDKKQKYILFAILLVLLVVAMVVIIVKNRTVSVAKTSDVDYHAENEPVAQTGEIPEEPKEDVQEEETENGTDETEVEPEENEGIKVTPVSNVTNSKQGIYYIKVNLEQNVVTIYSKDEDGEYTIPVRAMVCSTGKATPTSGTYTIPNREWDRWTWGQMVGNVWAQYYVRIKGSILFHSVPYTSKDKSTLEYWEYDKLGTKASAGCIRLTVQDAKWIYDNCKDGSKVEFYSDPNPGPLGKPTAQKISDDEEVRGWDPTDPDNDNPWMDYTRPTNKNTVPAEELPPID